MTWVLLVLWFDITDTPNKHKYIHKCRGNKQGPIDWNRQRHIHQYHLLYPHSSYMYYIEWTTHWSFWSKMPLLFKNYSLVELKYQQMRLNKTKSFLGNTKKTDGKTKQTHTHTHTHTQNITKYAQKDNIKKCK